MGLSIAQRKALAIVPKVTGVLSMTGSGLIIYDILPNRKKRKKTYFRIMCAMSIFDFVTSFMYALSTWPIPAESGALYASGTEGTCIFQGFFIQLSLAAPLYNLSLAIYYLLFITYQWKEREIKKLERFLHPAIMVIAFGIAIAGLPLRLYNNSNVWCWIAPDAADPNRGDNANFYRFALFYVELWFIIITVTILMSAVVLTIVRTEMKSAKYAMRSLSLSRQVFIQSVSYVSIFYLSWTFPTTLRILQTIGTPVPYAIFLCAVIFTPLQGFFNSLVYLKKEGFPFIMPSLARLARTTVLKRAVEKGESQHGTSRTGGDDGEQKAEEEGFENA
uniref:G-protein coupled receptors family 1 profile domain-containing protein n=1 Tax=Ditylum brightwellii TaxID=49249 RepID=A0A7S2EJG5_9STRA|mmetsp:Transcript_31725/g.47294  ORF Transcript_31725/g.47294 Transcript_31725/m.47294 type:complete len:333 (+) Transcript_31725:36-1034(+)